MFFYLYEIVYLFLFIFGFRKYLVDRSFANKECSPLRSLILLFGSRFNCQIAVHAFSGINCHELIYDGEVV